MAKIRILTARGVNALPEGFHADGGNLYLRVRNDDSRAWVFRYKEAGKVRELGLGSVTSRTLLQARELAGRMRTALADGQDPAALLKVQRDSVTMTFETYAKDYIAANRSGWSSPKHIQQWENTLRDYVFPTIGKKQPADITLADIKAILLPIWDTKTETATRVRERIETVLDYAAVDENDLGRPNPARWRGLLNRVLPPPRKVKTVVNHPAAPFTDVPRIMDALRKKDHISAQCLRFVILTAARSGEGRGALWSEIDMENRAWIIPKSRMKARRDHRVPLNDEAMEILTRMKAWPQGESGRVFPGLRDGLLSDQALNKTLHRIVPDITVHGFRASFRTWASKAAKVSKELSGLALAHTNRDKSDDPYQRDDLFDNRIEVMALWGRFCGSANNVVKLVKSA